MDITDRLRRPLVSHAPPEAIPDRELRRALVDDRSDALVEIVRLRAAATQAVEIIDRNLHHQREKVADAAYILRAALNPSN